MDASEVRSLFCPVTHYPNLKSALDTIRAIDTVRYITHKTQGDDLIGVLIVVLGKSFVVMLQEQATGGWVFLRLNDDT